MRIVDEWAQDNLRCTVMIMNGRYSLKVEANLLEQTYKFRDGQITSLEDLKSRLTEGFFTHCQKTFVQMSFERNSLFPKTDASDFPVIV